MTHFKTVLMTAAILSMPSVAFAQLSTGAVTDQLKDKAVQGVIDNATPDDALTVGKTLLKGGSKEDAALAIVKNRAEDKVQGFTGENVSLDDLSADGLMKEGKDIAVEKAKGSATTYTDKAKGSATSYSAPVIQKSGGTVTSTTTTAPAATTTAPAVNCPTGTKDAGDGTCMITGDWNF